ncbi:MAG: tRNA pseudouridine(55) synthase TruB [Isosphaeraceae bacterium]
MNGLLNLNKPAGMTSRRVVDQVVRLVPRTKVGHAGTLDPAASGVLVVCMSAATRLIECVQRMPKTYLAAVRLGARSDTLDAEGEVVEVEAPPIPDEEAVRAAIAGQVGEILQRPPEFSALRVKGRRAHELARAGKAVELAPRIVRVDRISLLRYEWPRLDLEIDCGGGTYIRSIARDLGESLGCGGLLERLVRSRIGHFTIETAAELSALTAEALPSLLRSPREAVAGMQSLTLHTEEHIRAVAQGKTLAADALSSTPLPPGPLALLGPDGRLVALAESDPSRGAVHPFKVFI